MLAYAPRSEGKNRMSIAFATPEGRVVVVAGNFEDEPASVAFKVNGKYINETLEPHSFNSFVI